jgi:hypothetical protein
VEGLRIEHGSVGTGDGEEPMITLADFAIFKDERIRVWSPWTGSRYSAVWLPSWRLM